MSGHAPTSRSREAPQGDEEASSELKLGEFQDVDALTHSEAALVINALVQKRSADRKNVNETEYDSLSSSRSFCEVFGESVRSGLGWQRGRTLDCGKGQGLGLGARGGMEAGE